MAGPRAATPPPTKKDSAQSKQSKMPDTDEAGFVNMIPMFLLLMLIPRFIGVFFAVALFKNGSTDGYTKAIDGMESSGQGWVFLSAVVISMMTAWLNNYPMLYKNMVMRLDSGNLRANMMIYKSTDAGSSSGYTVLETEGAIGSYNRANRSLTHFTENGIPFVVLMLLGGQVFPFPTFVLTVVFAVGRMLHQMGYASSGYGGHTVGFMLSWFSSGFLEMLVLLAGMKSLGLIPAMFAERFEL